MGLVLVRGAIIQCSHGGQLKLSVGDARVTVHGNGVVTSGMENGLTFGSPVASVPDMVLPCTAQTPTTPPQFQPCVTAAAAPAGLARKLTVGDQPVLVDTATGTTVSGAGPGTWKVSDPGQTILQAI
jgi:hypothetical protein